MRVKAKKDAEDIKIKFDIDVKAENNKFELILHAPQSN